MTSCPKVPVRVPPEQSQVYERSFQSESRGVDLCAAAAPITYHHHLRQRVLRLERALDPRGPRFENAGLWRKGGGEVQQSGVVIG